MFSLFLFVYITLRSRISSRKRFHPLRVDLTRRRRISLRDTSIGVSRQYSVLPGKGISENSKLGSSEGKYYKQSSDGAERGKGEPRSLAYPLVPLKLPYLINIGYSGGYKEDGDIELSKKSAETCLEILPNYAPAKALLEEIIFP